MFNINRLFPWFLVILLVAGCTSTTLTASWKNPEYNAYLENIYIVGVSRDNITRRLFEDSFKMELAKMGVNGIVSYKDFATGDDSKDKVMDIAQARQADSILISRMVKKRTETVVQPGRVTAYGPGYYPYFYPYYRTYSDFYTRRYEMIYEPPMVSRYDVATIEANLYSTASGDLIWTAQLEIVADRDLKKNIRDFIAVVINDLRAKRLL